MSEMAEKKDDASNNCWIIDDNGKHIRVSSIVIVKMKSISNATGGSIPKFEFMINIVNQIIGNFSSIANEGVFNNTNIYYLTCNNGELARDFLKKLGNKSLANEYAKIFKQPNPIND